MPMSAAAPSSRTFGLITFVLTVALLLMPLGGASAVGAVAELDIEYADQNVPLRGFLAMPEGVLEPGDRAGVLVVPEWWGLNDYARRRARMLADLGYVVFVADMYGFDTVGAAKVTTEASQAQVWAGALYGDKAAFRARVNAVLGVLLARPEVDARRVAAIGYCFGGSAVQELAFSGAAVQAVVSFHGGPRVPSDADAARVAELGTVVMVCNGAADPMVGAGDVASWRSRMDAAGADYVWIDYGGAVHGFTNPGAGRAGIEGVAYDAAADRRSWRHMLALFDEVLAAE